MVRGGSNLYSYILANIRVFFLMKFFNSYSLKNLCILHGQDFVMKCSIVASSEYEFGDKECFQVFNIFSINLSNCSGCFMIFYKSFNIF